MNNMLIAANDLNQTISLHDEGPAGLTFHLTQCDTREKILGCVVRLSKEPWATKEHLDAFISMASILHGGDLPEA